MARVSVDVKLVSSVTQVVAHIDRTAGARVVEAANLVRNRVIEKLAGPRSGRQYRVPGTNRLYTASAPGEPPAVMLGRLRQSIQVQLTQDEHQVAAHVGSDLEKAVWLEKGTRSMAPRPFLGPAFEETRAEVEAILSQRWDE